MSSIFGQIEFKSSNLPIVIIETYGQEILDDPRIVANMKIIYNKNSINKINDNIYNYNGRISIEIRGSSSQSFPKKQYGFETQNFDGSNNDVSLIDLPSENDWILYAPYSDKTLIRNILAYKLSETLGHYAPRTKLCEVVLNEEYIGIYVLTEKIKKDVNRVNISNLDSDDINEDDISGGYIVKIDKTTGSSCQGWNTKLANVYFQYEYPECEIIVDEQKSFIQTYINSFEEALFSENIYDTNSAYHHYLDVNSAIDYFIINEISKNIDGYFLSTYLYKDKNSKICFGPVWDYNLAFGNADYKNAYRTDEILAGKFLWWEKLLQDSVFTKKLNCRWHELREKELNVSNILNIIDSLSSILDEAQIRNFEKWEILDKYIWPNYYIGGSYDNELRFLKSWLLNRINWLDNNLPGQCDYYQPSGFYDSNIFPNPFDYFFTYSFSLKESGIVSLYLIDSNGRFLTKIINNKHYNSGNHKVTWNSYINEYQTTNTFYILILELNNRIVAKEKIIKKHK